jgi:PS-10 peptidase S37
LVCRQNLYFSFQGSLKMAQTFRLVLSAVVAAMLLLNCGVPEGAAQAEPGVQGSLSSHGNLLVPVDPILDALKAVAGLTVEEIQSVVPGTRGFRLGLTQPVDHFDTTKGTFQHRAVLTFRDVAKPMILYATGYNIPVSRAFSTELTELFGANQLLIEHRYFAGSTPQPTDWKYLNIKEAAFDQHRYVEALKPIFQAAWLNTGASKGGMTSIYHRRYFPNDVVGTVADVAPQSYGRDDPRYQLFLERVGPLECRKKIVSAQRAMLSRRAELLPLLEQLAATNAETFVQVGGLEKAFEHAVQEYRFAFWQYFGETECPTVPAADAPALDLLAALENTVGVAALAGDFSFSVFNGYYYQALSQLGTYGPLEIHLRDLLKYPRTYLNDSYSPVKPPRFDYRAMPEVQAFVGLFGERLMFVYGENDPWTAGQFQVLAAQDSYKYVVPKGTHGSSITQLPEPQRSESIATLSRWLGVSPVPQMAVQTLEQQKAAQARDEALLNPTRKSLLELYRSELKAP